MKRTKPIGGNATVPSVSTIENAYGALKKHLIFHYNWQPSAQLTLRVDSFLNEKVLKGSLVRGQTKPKEFISTHLLNRMLQAWIVHGLEKGCRNFDAVLLKALPFAMMQAVDARLGDLVTSKEYKNTACYMRFEDIELYVEGGNKLEFVQGCVTIKYGKGNKLTHGNDRERTVGRLNDPTYNCIDFILLLFAYALRLDQFLHGPDVQNVLNHAYHNKPLGTIEWRNPQQPLFCQLGSRTHQLNRHELMYVDESRGYFQEIVRTAGLTRHVTPHAIRYGGAQELVRMDQGHLEHATPGIAENMGHNRTSLQQGVTSKYTGFSEIPINTLKYAIPESRKSLSLQSNRMTSHRKNRLSTDDISLFIHENIEHWKSRLEYEAMREEDVV